MSTTTSYKHCYAAFAAYQFAIADPEDFRAGLDKWQRPALKKRLRRA
ncbi:MAG: hypothetical protein QM763_23370 [Agriterribacter sp.]